MERSREPEVPGPSGPANQSGAPMVQGISRPAPITGPAPAPAQGTSTTMPDGGSIPLFDIQAHLRSL